VGLEKEDGGGDCGGGIGLGALVPDGGTGCVAAPPVVGVFDGGSEACLVLAAELLPAELAVPPVVLPLPPLLFPADELPAKRPNNPPLGAGAAAAGAPLIGMPIGGETGFRCVAAFTSGAFSETFGFQTSRAVWIAVSTGVGLLVSAATRVGTVSQVAAPTKGMTMPG
jgi:hypothetical protein